MSEKQAKSDVPAELKEAGELVHAFREHALAARRIQEIAIKNTLPSDWVDFGGQAWLDTPGAERVARALGLSVKDWTWERVDYKDEEGEYFVITSRGFVGHAPSNLWVEAVGTQWSRKPFWYKDGERKRSLSEINPGLIVKDAYSDMFRNGVCRLLGLRGLPWDYLEELGIRKQATKRVEFKTKKKPAAKDKAPEPESAPQKASTDQVHMLCRIGARKIIGYDEDRVLHTLPFELNTSQLNQLLSYLAKVPGEIEEDQWKQKLSEVTGQAQQSA